MAAGTSITPREQRIGRALNQLIARAPWLWPLIRWPMRKFFSDKALGWDLRTSAGSSEHLAALAGATLHVTPSPERALDIGCGTGAATLFLAREFPQARVRGIDISPEMIDAAITKVGLDPEGRVAFKVGDAAAIPYADDSFDLVAQLNMPPFFDEIVRVVRPGGHVVIAASYGDQTPFYTPGKLLDWKLRQRGVEPVMIGEAGLGTFYVGRLTESPQMHLGSGG